MAKRLPFVFLAVALGVGCAESQKPAMTPPMPERVAAQPTLRSVDGGFTDGADGPTPTEADLPGYPLDQVLPSLSRQILAYSKDAFSYDGCATTLQECLKQPAHQRHALRMLQLATGLASAGATNTEINTSLNKYYTAFAASERVPLSVDDGMCRGPADAKVTIVEFSDFECPFCRLARPVLESLVTPNGMVRLCFKPFPLKMHPHSDLAAEAAYFAKAQGKFWPMHDAMFEHQEALDVSDLQRYASDAELDPHRLMEAIQSNAFQSLIEASKEEGHRAKVKGTPSIFINGRDYELPMSAEDLTHAIDDELEWQTNGGKWGAQ
ncbi:MAG: thioredoxin domain-containing protein [Deltaproteobacteria bacterium]|nr:thioredoxin domain-containing protein [Deltaproteobacteria bacterium]